MFVNIIKTYRDVVAVCDKELLGKRFEEDIRLLDVKESFYKGQEKTEAEAFDILTKFSAEDATFNIVGKKSVDVAIRAGIISKELVGEVQGIPFALTLL